jgi:hypothetical protein
MAGVTFFMAATEEFHPDLLAPPLRDLGARGGSAEIPVHGNSVHPMRGDGDRFRVVPATGTKLRVGDVVALMEPTGPVIHRLVGWCSSRRSWRSPAGSAADGDSVIGRVTARVRDGRVQRLDWAGRRIRAIASLVVGLIVEVWGRAHGRARTDGA